ncbi:MAG: hypothetical protein JSR48_02360 [Verrucomicrobia bacterium]|nr:hypothetical protein [Verrucomicrobiota bacterium]
MPGLPLQTDAFVLLKRPATDAFQGFQVFSPEHGALLVHQRIVRKAAATNVTLDLFDEVSLRLESPSQGQTWFVLEARLVTRHPGLGRSYDTLRHAAALATLVARNPVHEDSRASVAQLLRTAFAALAAGRPPEVVWLKSLYVFARDEGYPVKQDWLPALPAGRRAEADHLLFMPLAAEPVPPTGRPATVGPLVRSLEDYLRGHTDILLG